MTAPVWQRWLPDCTAGLATLVLGLLETYVVGFTSSVGRRPDILLFVLLLTAAVTVARHLPAAALTLIWVAGFLQVAWTLPLLLVEVCVCYVAFACSRWGRLATLWTSLVSIPAVALIGAIVVRENPYGTLVPLLQQHRSLQARLYDGYDAGLPLILVGIVGLGLLLGLPWLAGLAVRMTTRARTSEAHQAEAEADRATALVQAEQAEQIAQLREDQARLARDVHDVVGHSLAVILAQAESAQFRDDLDSAKLKETMATIATSARSSLRDVRQVLRTTSEAGAPAAAAATDRFTELVDGVRGAGAQVEVSEEGRPQPLPPDLAEVAHRVLQEMLTNAMRHGRRGAVIHVERHWEGELRLEVRNLADPTPSADETQPMVVTAPDAEGGQGLLGMRRRVEAVGGHLDVRRRADAAPGGEAVVSWTTTAWIPVRAR
ncbi:sensor histidine kinase [Nocardioides acrostichi]|uniref:histidine kinase n=1 Tax=Nocardioides acrostichi TaxID=2784339 RepID=A0A930UZU7_9ACTN|nr:histidine kinase [Nocardioides acrostichi]MBF4161100.1 hypothetical protein [Nocardioides acrostichi]